MKMKNKKKSEDEKQKQKAKMKTKMKKKMKTKTKILGFIFKFYYGTSGGTSRPPYWCPLKGHTYLNKPAAHLLVDTRQ